MDLVDIMYSFSRRTCVKTQERHEEHGDLFDRLS